MSWVNYDDVVDQLVSAGLELDGPVEVDTPKPVRVREAGGDREKRAWYWLSSKTLDGQSYITGACGVFRGSDSGKVPIRITLDGKRVQVTKEDRAAMAARQKAQMARLKAMRQAQAERAAQKAATVWRAYVAEGESDYLKRKHVGAHGVRFSPQADTLAIPMMDTAGRIHGLQIIRGKDRPTGKLEKEYWPKGLVKTGHFNLVGGLPTWLVLVTEGYATAATLHQSTGYPVAVAFDAGNLRPVAEAIKKAYPHARILVCADDDYLQRCKACRKLTPVEVPECQHCGGQHGNENPGQVAAASAAHAVDGRVVAPAFAEARSPTSKGPTDFNDLAAAEGEATVRAQVAAALRDLGWETPGDPARDTAPEGSGEGVRRRAQSVIPLDQAIHRFIPLDDGTGEHLWDDWTHRPVKQKQMVALLPAGVRWDDVKRDPLWISRGAYYIDEVGFDPSGNDPTVKLNTWRGWPMEPKAGNCQRILDLLEYLCSGENNSREVYQWILRWMAYPLQHPGAKMASALILHGPQGTGKSAVFQTLAKIYGDHATVLNQRGLEDKFNSDWADSKLFILAEEVVTRAEMWHIKNELKELVTGEWIRVNPKNLPAYRQRNQVNIAYLSNEHQPLPLENDDRRHCVVWTPPELSEAYYDEVFLEIHNGGAAALYHHLLQLDLGDFHPKKRPPMTRSKEDLISLSRPSEDRFLREWRGGDLDLPFCPCLSGDVYTAYLRWCRANGEIRPRPSNHFLAHLGKIPGWKAGKQSWVFDATGKLRQRRMVMPSATDMEAAVKRGEDRRPTPDKTDQQWLTACYVDFREALNSAESDR